jgi:hypothetical protein
MKITRLITVFLATLLLYSLSLQAAGPPKADALLAVKVKQGATPKSLTLQFDDLKNEPVKVVIQDGNSRVWYSKKLAADKSANSQLDLSGIPSGNYILYASNRNGRFAKAFSFDFTGVVFFENALPDPEANGMALLTGGKQKGKLVTYITQESDQALGLQLANLKEKAAKVSLIRAGEGLAYSENIRNVHAWAKRIKFEGMPRGAYFLYVETEEATIWQIFTLSKNGVHLGDAQCMTTGCERG